MKKLNVNFPEKISRFESLMNRRYSIRTSFYRKIFRGKGSEFENYRRYTEEDDASLIDWKATLRANMPLVRQYIEEIKLKIFFIVDVGENMVFGSGKKLKNEASAEIAACLSHIILNSGDKIGYALCSDNIIKEKGFLPGIKQFFSFESELKNPKNYGGKTDMKKCLRKLIPKLKKASAIFIITDFIKINKDYLNALKELGYYHETIGIMVRDPVDDKLPNLNREIIVEDIYTGEQILINPSIIKEEYNRNTSLQKRKIENFLKKINSDFLDIYTEEDYIKKLANFLKKRLKSKNHMHLRKNPA